MALPRDRALLVKAARLYYEQDLSQDEVAMQIGVSRSNVSRMLTDARAQGIVQIRIVEHALRDPGLESRIRELLPIKNVRVARSLNALNELATVGSLAGEAVTERLRPNSTIAVSWGSTLQAVVNGLEPDITPGIKLVPLVGGMTALSTGVNGDDLIRHMAEKLGATYSTVLAPVVVSSPESRDAFISEPSVAKVLEEAASADMALVGIGSRHGSSTMDLLTEAGLSNEKFNQLTSQMAGDVAARLYDVDGKQIDHGWSNRIIGLSLDQIRRIPFVIGVASGANKALGVIGAIRGGLISEVIISTSCAMAIIRYLDSEQGLKAS